MRLTQKRGVTVLEGLLAAGVLPVILVALFVGFRQSQKSARNVQGQAAADQVDYLIKATLLKRMWDFYDSAAPGCATSGFETAIGGTLVDTIVARPINPATIDAQLPDDRLGPEAKTAKQRCRTNQTPYQGSGQFSGALAFYFCVELQDTGVASAASVVGSGVTFAEVSFSFLDQMLGAPVSCAQYPSYRTVDKQPLATLVYSLRWHTREPSGEAPHHRFAIYSRGTRP